VCFGFGPIVRWRAEKTAQKRGLSVEIGTVWPAFGGVNLRKVRFRAADGDWLTGELAKVDVRVGLGLGLRAPRVAEGKITLAGSVEEVSERARAMNKSSGTEKSAEGDTSGPELRLEGLRLAWTGALGGASSIEVEGVRAERAAADGGAQRGMVGVDAV